MTSHKRKHRAASYSAQSQNPNTFTFTGRDLSPGPALYIQAYEADIIRGPRAALAAKSLEVSQTDDTSTTSPEIGDSLIKWNGYQFGAQAAFPQDEDDFVPATTTTSGKDSHAIWVDRYDARLLLDTLPPTQPSALHQPVPDSPGGWSDLPSDNEDVFFFSLAETEDFRRDKKRRHIEQAREERVQARRAEDGAAIEEEEEVWGGSDEEPDEPQRELMRRTVTHLMSSPNPAQLEMRILANHGSDRRFAFLRGRWSRAWKILKGKARIEKEKEQKAEKTGKTGLGALAGYGDSDADSEDSDGPADEAETAVPPPEILPAPSPPLQESEKAVMEARRARAKEWAEKRRLAKEDNTT